jgi:putative transposase
MSLRSHTTVYGYFQKWQRKGIWHQIHDQVRQQVRQKVGREADSTVAITDSQSVKTTKKKGPSTASMVAKRLRAVSAISS